MASSSFAQIAVPDSLPVPPLPPPVVSNEQALKVCAGEQATSEVQVRQASAWPASGAAAGSSERPSLPRLK